MGLSNPDFCQRVHTPRRVEWSGNRLKLFRWRKLPWPASIVGTAVLGFLMLTSTSQAQHPRQSISFGDYQWDVEAKESQVEEHLGRQSLYLQGGQAIVKGSEFTDGIIEYDVAFGPQPGFIGVMWRLQDSKNYEEFYMRPHQSGNPDANQYTPIFHGIAGWQLYYGEGYGVPITYPFNTWIHVKIVVSGKQAEVYINDMNQPALFISELKREIQPGKVGIEVAEVPPFAPAHFANFRYTPMSNPPLKGTAKAPEPAPAGTLRSWQVSEAFDEQSLVGKVRLTDADKKNFKTWIPLPSERTGLANLARVQGVGEGKNTVFARVTIVAEGKQIKPLTFGFSDRIKVYLNDQLLYAGSDVFLSRDYRFLGTIGWFDAVYLPLKRGENELWLAVTEDFPLGGWGVQARFEDMAGIEVK
jgi:hypothetical protein